MKKIMLVALLLIVVTTGVCQTTGKEKEIKKALMEFVNSNTTSPKKVERIISVEMIKSFDFEQFRTKAIEFLSEDEKLQNATNTTLKFLDKHQEMFKNEPIASQKVVDELDSLLKVVPAQEKALLKFREVIRKTSGKKGHFEEYVVKVAIQTKPNGDLEDADYYAYTFEDGSIKVREPSMLLDVLPPYWKELLLISMEYTKQTDLKINCLKRLNKIISSLND